MLSMIAIKVFAGKAFKVIGKLYGALPSSAKVALIVALALYGMHWWTERTVTKRLNTLHASAMEEQKQKYEGQIKKAQDAYNLASAHQKQENEKALKQFAAQYKALEKKKQEVLTITERVTEYVTKKADNLCTITDGFVWMHDYPLDAARTDGLPPSEPRDVDAASGITVSTVAKTVSANYAECEARGKLITLWQDWYRQAAQTHKEAVDIWMRRQTTN